MGTVSPGVTQDGTSTTAATSWLPAATDRADALASWVRLLAASASEPSFTATAERLLAEARQALTSSDRGHGAFLQAVVMLDMVEVEALRLVPDPVLGAALPDTLYRVRLDLPEDDPRRDEMERAVAAGRRPSRDTMISALGSANRRRSAALIRHLRIRRVTAIAAVGIAVLVALLVLAGALWPQALSLCTADTPAVCPGGSAPRPTDVAVIALTGMLGGALSAAIAMRRMTRSPLGFSLAATLVKLPAGALTAVTGLFLLLSGALPGSGGFDTPAQLLAYAVVFGYAQQLITAPIDRRLRTSAGALPRPGVLHTSARLPVPRETADTHPTPVEPQPRRPEPARPAPRWGTRLLPLLVMVLAAVIALTPLAVTGQPVTALLIGGAAMLAGVSGPLRRSRPPAQRPPAGAIAVAISGAAGPLAVAVCGWLLVEAAGYLLVLLVNQLFDAGWPASTIAVWSGAAAGSVLLLGAGGVGSASVSAFLPRHAPAVPAPYERLARRRRFRFGVLAGECGTVAALALIAQWSGESRFYLAVIAEAVLVFAGLAVLGAARSQGTDEPGPDERTIAAALTRAGWSVTPRPRLGVTEIDALLRKVDLIAEQPGQTLVVHIVSPEDTAPSWHAAADLVVACQALGRHVAAGTVIDPVLVLVGREPDEPLLRIAEARSVRLVHGPDLGAVASALGRWKPHADGMTARAQ